VIYPRLDYLSLGSLPNKTNHARRVSYSKVGLDRRNEGRPTPNDGLVQYEPDQA
jgi:hypothetical protein